MADPISPAPVENPLDPVVISRLKLVSNVAEGVGVAMGLLVLTGWAAGNVTLMGVFPGLVPMNPMTAVMFILSAAALHARRERASSRAVRVLSALVFLAGACRLAGYAGWDIGLDRLLFSGKLNNVPFGPNRMAPNTAINFTLLGLSLLFMDVETARGFRPAQFLCLGVASFSTLAVIGYSYRVLAFYQITSYIPMALNTALTFHLLAAGVLFARPDKGVMSLISADTGGGMLARRLLPAAVLVPFLLGWLRLAGEKAGLYTSDFGGSLLVLATMAAITVIVFATAASLHRSDLKKHRAEDEVLMLNRALQENAARLGEANKELESFSYSVSHDLRAPLRSIDGFSRALEEDCAGALDERGREHLVRIRSAAGRMGELIEGLLGLARTARKQVDKELLDLSDLARAAAVELKKESPGRNVDFVIEEGLLALGDRVLIRSAFDNLLGNAWKYSAKKDSARIEFGRRPPIDGQETYFIRDNGAGFDPHYADKLFRVFQRLHTTEEFAGTGVGLATVQKIIQRHGGRVWAEAAVGEGATFFFSLPPTPPQGPP